MGKDAELLEAARNGSLQVVEKILSARSRRSGPLARSPALALTLKKWADRPEVIRHHGAKYLAGI
ncbi:hypothetical protein E2C01_022787 [Portunus trituberculatus]|uniref:Uncharacterized protein n=1 Tax=Portunus trituberculatus TaxID=210409 RepID=A0A5B7E8J6_PORTR|nr:hypothetical protein [Portunus trituberculatus]